MALMSVARKAVGAALLLGPLGLACARAPAEPATVLRVDQQGLNQRLAMATTAPEAKRSTKSPGNPTTDEVKTPPSEELESVRNERRGEFEAGER